MLHTFLQDIPAHVSTPHHVQSNVHTPQHPLSTSAPSHFPHLTPHTAMETPVEMVLASGRQKGVEEKGAERELCSYLLVTCKYMGLIEVVGNTRS